MKVKLIALFAVLSIALVAALIGGSKAKPKPDQRQAEELEAREKRYGLTFRERVKLAKLRNQQKITIRRSYGAKLFATSDDMDTVAALFTIVIAKPVAAIARLNERDEIVTSYRFQTVEVLSEPGPQRWPFTFSGSLPPELGAFGEGDFMTSIDGGTKEVDGVEVIEKYEDYELFSVGKEYLLFLDFDTTRTVGGRGMGPTSALEIGPGGTLNTLDRNPSHGVKRTIDSRFGNSVEVLKSYLKSRPKR